MRADHPSMRGRRLVTRRAQAPDGHPVLRVTGELDHDTLPELRLAWRTVLAERPERLVVDLGSVWHADALAGVAAFVDLARTSRRLGVPVSFGNVPETVRRALVETHLAPGEPIVAR